MRGDHDKYCEAEIRVANDPRLSRHLLFCRCSQRSDVRMREIISKDLRNLDPTDFDPFKYARAIQLQKDLERGIITMGPEES